MCCGVAMTYSSGVAVDIVPQKEETLITCQIVQFMREGEEI